MTRCAHLILDLITKKNNIFNNFLKRMTKNPNDQMCSTITWSNDQENPIYLKEWPKTPSNFKPFYQIWPYEENYKITW